MHVKVRVKHDTEGKYNSYFHEARLQECITQEILRHRHLSTKMSYASLTGMCIHRIHIPHERTVVKKICAFIIFCNIELSIKSNKLRSDDIHFYILQNIRKQKKNKTHLNLCKFHQT